jgi:hypothetical protein
MWSRVLMRLLSLSFMSFFVIGLLWQHGRRPGEAGRQNARKGKPRRRDTVADYR